MNALITAIILITSFLILFAGLMGLAEALNYMGIIELKDDE